MRGSISVGLLERTRVFAKLGRSRFRMKLERVGVPDMSWSEVMGV